MRVPTGATGFDAPPVDEEADVRAFAAVCHHAARATSGVVGRTVPAEQTRNFHSTEIIYRTGGVTVLKHAVVPLVAFADPHISFGNITFVDHPGLAAVVESTSEFRVLTVDQLALPLSRADLTDLGPAERSETAFWRPDTVGELMFNFWD